MAKACEKLDSEDYLFSDTFDKVFWSVCIFFICTIIIIIPLLCTYETSAERFDLYNGFEKKFCQELYPYHNIKVKVIDNKIISRDRVNSVEYCLFQLVNIVPGNIKSEKLNVCGQSKQILENYVKENKDEFTKSYSCYYNKQKNKIKLDYKEYYWYSVVFNICCALEVVSLCLSVTFICCCDTYMDAERRLKKKN